MGGVYRGVKAYRRALKEAQKELEEALAEGMQLDILLKPLQERVKVIERLCLAKRRVPQPVAGPIPAPIPAPISARTRTKTAKAKKTDMHQ